MNWYTYGINQIDRELARIDRILDGQQLSTLDRLFWEGRQRELRAARWLIRRLAAPIPAEINVTLPDPPPVSLPPVTAENSSTVAIANLLNPRPLPGRNLTSIPLEIDILRLDRQQELLQIIWRQLQRTIRELQDYQVSQEQLRSKLLDILTSIWSESTTEFIGQYYAIVVNSEEYPVLPYLLQDRQVIAAEFLTKIPLVFEIFSYLLFQDSIVVDNELREYGDRIASDRIQQLLDNLVISMSNAVTQPLLNRFSDFEQIKQRFFEPRLISTRDITKFRNLLSWHYHRYKYLIDPTDTFESRHTLWIFTPRGIEQTAIYSPRRQELTALKGVPLIVTLGLELRDAIAPPLTLVTTFFGRIIVYILTEIIGRGIGLITKGILQGVGNAWQSKSQ